MNVIVRNFSGGGAITTSHGDAFWETCLDCIFMWDTLSPLPAIM